MCRQKKIISWHLPLFIVFFRNLKIIFSAICVLPLCFYILLKKQKTSPSKQTNKKTNPQNPVKNKTKLHLYTQLSNLSRSLWMAAQPSGVSTTPPRFVSSADLLRMRSVLSSRSLMNDLNRPGTSTDHWGTPLAKSCLNSSLCNWPKSACFYRCPCKHTQALVTSCTIRDILAVLLHEAWALVWSLGTLHADAQHWAVQDHGMQRWCVSWFLIWVDALGCLQLWGRKQCEYGGNLPAKGKAGTPLRVQQEKKMWKMPVILSDYFIF